MKVIPAGGAQIDLGTVEAAPTISIIDYSRRQTDDFGVTTVVKRGFARRLSVRLAVPFANVDSVQRRLADLRATPARWVADDRFAWLNFDGFYKDFEVDLAVPPLSYCTLTIEGLAETAPAADTGGDPAPVGTASRLKLLQPADVRDAALAASSVPENEHPEWAAGATYPAGARVIRSATHRIYESLSDDNRGNDPAGAAGRWLDIGPTNRWAMFDQALGTATTTPGSIAVTLNVAAANAIALLDVIASTVRVRAPGYDRTLQAGAGAVTFLDLPETNGEVTVTITGPAQVSIGTLLVGRLVSLGVTEASPKAGILDFSRKETDDFGEVTVVPRAWAKRMSARSLIRTDAIDQVANRIASVRAVPCLWIGGDGLDSLTVYGFFKEFSVEVGENVSKLSLSIEGLSTAAPAPEPVVPEVAWPNVTDPAGTKPADNADKTSENTSKDTEAVGGKPAASVLDQISGNTFNLVRAAAEAELGRLRTRALNFLGPAGEDSYTLIRRETTERKDADGVFAETFDLLGARTSDGTAFVLDTSTVRISATESMAQRFDAISATFAGNTASIEHIDQVLVGPEGASARALLTVDVNGRIIGTALTNDGTAGSFVISADNVRIEDPDTGKPYFYADDAGKVLMHDVEVDTLKIGAMDREFLEKQTPFDGSQGSQMLPGGVIMKWGSYRAPLNDEIQLSIVFTEPFPLGCDTFVPTPYISSFSSLRDLWIQVVGEPTRFGASVSTQAATKSEQRLDGFNWLAFGR